jgi:hypothetical protein
MATYTQQDIDAMLADIYAQGDVNKAEVGRIRGMLGTQMPDTSNSTAFTNYATRTGDARRHNLANGGEWTNSNFEYKSNTTGDAFDPNAWAYNSVGQYGDAGGSGYYQIIEPAIEQLRQQYKQIGNSNVLSPDAFAAQYKKQFGSDQALNDAGFGPSTNPAQQFNQISQEYGRYLQGQGINTQPYQISQNDPIYLQGAQKSQDLAQQVFEGAQGGHFKSGLWAPLAVIGGGLLAGGGAAGAGAGTGAGAGAGGSMAAADALGLSQMGQAAGLSGGALDAFVASGGALGSTAAGGAGVGLGMSSAGGASASPFVGGASGGGAAAGEGLLGGATGAGTSGATGGALITGAGSAAVPWAVGSAPSIIGPTGLEIGTGVSQAGAAPWYEQLWNTVKDIPGLSSFLPGSGDGSGLNWGNILSGLGQAGLGYLGADKMADAYQNIYNQTRADRMPALGAFNTALQNPNDFYNSAPAMGATDAVLRKLSMQGNPASNPGLLSQAAAYNLGGYNDYLRALSGPAFGTTNSEINVASGAANAQGGGLNALGFGLNTAMQQPSALDDYYRAMTRKLNTGMPNNGVLGLV